MRRATPRTITQAEPSLLMEPSPFRLMRFVSGPPDLVNTVRRKDVMGTALSAPGHSVSCDICCFPVALQPAHRPRRNPRLDLALDPDGLAADAPCARKFSLAHPSPKRWESDGNAREHLRL